MRIIRLGDQIITGAQKRAVMRVLDGDQLSPGALCTEFARLWSKRHGARYGLFVNSGTDALRIALLAMKEKYGWRDGDPVAIPSVTFIATRSIVLQAKLVPMMVDVGMYDFLLNPSNLKRRIHAGVRAVIPVHLFGKKCNIPVGLPILEDSCEAGGMRLSGDIAAYSTYVCHHVSTGVGGMVVTNDKDLNYLMWSYANHGRRRPGYFEFDRVGYSSRATELQAALGIEHLARLDMELEVRRRLSDKLTAGLSVMTDFILPTAGSLMAYPIAIKEASRLNRDKFCFYLNKNGIETRELMPLVRFTGESLNDFPIAAWLDKKGFYIGCHPGMTSKDVDYIIKVFRDY